MKHDFTAILKGDGKWWVGFCPEISGANAQGLTREDCRVNLSQAIELVLEDRGEA
jgi:predicted RNase H-like HicB family nuclease